MKQPIKGGGIIKRPKPKKPKKKGWFAYKNTSNQKYGTSKLERDFAKEFLDANGIRYIYQYEAKDIKRFYDFMIVDDDNAYIFEDKDGIHCIRQENQFVDIQFAIEIDGSYWHSDPRVIGEKKLNSTQRHTKFVDGLKDMWCQEHHIPLLRIWEYDIRHNPKLVLEQINQYISVSKSRQKMLSNRKRPH